MDRKSLVRSMRDISQELEEKSSTDLIQLELPSNELSFEYRSLSKYISSQFEIFNRSKNNKFFRIKTTSPKYYVIRPNVGIIPENGKTMISLFMKAEENTIEKRLQDRFLLEAMETVVSNEEFKDLNKQDPSVFWKRKEDYCTRYQRIELRIGVKYREEVSEKRSRSKSPLSGQINRDSSPVHSKSFNNILESPQNRLIKNTTLAQSRFIDSEPTSINFRLENKRTTGVRFATPNKESSSAHTSSSFIDIKLVKGGDISDLSDNLEPVSPRSKQMHAKKNIYKEKYEALSKKHKELQQIIEKIRNERNDYLNQLNKAKFIYENSLESARKAPVQEFQMSNIQFRHLLVISVTFIILGALIGSRRI